jgi:hypothetical protein
MKNNIENIDTSEVEPSDYKDKRCAPNLNFEKGSCIKLEILIEMANAYNKENSKNNIITRPELETLNPKLYKKYLLKQIKSKINTCSTQMCWTEQSFINLMKNKLKEELVKYTFRPEGPEGKFEWLNTIQINKVMDQYEKKYKDFKFFGAVPMDFDEIPSLGIKDLNFSKLVEEGKTKLGFVFNLDESWQSGSHWVALYADLNQCAIYYFDSYGIRPELRVRKLMRRIANYCKLVNKNSNIKSCYNKTRHQFENSECGVYSMAFILRLLQGESFEKISESKIPDQEINKCRNIFFNNPKIE